MVSASANSATGLKRTTHGKWAFSLYQITEPAKVVIMETGTVEKRGGDKPPLF